NGLPIHELWLRITIDRKLNVVDAQASSDWVPYPGQCEASNPAYRALIGLNLFHNFRRDAGRLLAGTAGCTHLTELCAVLPTAAIQAFAGDVWNTNNGGPDEAAGSGDKPAVGTDGSGVASRTNGTANEAASKATSKATSESPGKPPEQSIDKPPFQLGRCHALRFDGEAVRQFYPRWYGRAPRTADQAVEQSVKHAGSAADRTDRVSGASRISEKSGKEVQSNSQTEGNHA
ncbi:MAG: DUF2889 domain-containing protein, partial [Paraburkholderia sp.]|nr:DUF2889 domain-containing protein [Paraburkholderia sp.]